MSAYDEMTKSITNVQSLIVIRANFKNGVPQRYSDRIVITQVGAVFSFRNPRTESKGPYNVNLRTGESSIISSEPTQDCSDEIFGTMEVTDLLRRESTTISGIQKATKDHCLLQAPFELIIKSSVGSNDYAAAVASGRILDLLEITLTLNP